MPTEDDGATAAFSAASTAIEPTSGVRLCAVTAIVHAGGGGGSDHATCTEDGALAP